MYVEYHMAVDETAVVKRTLDAEDDTNPHPHAPFLLAPAVKDVTTANSLEIDESVRESPGS